MSNSDVSALFVYGTLKRGQCREACWPCTPVSVLAAWTLGELYDTGPYPAMFPGQDCVAGELWSFERSAIPVVLAELDQVEEYQPGSEATNLYNRCVVECFDQTGRAHRAFTYFYARRSEQSFFRRIFPAQAWAGRFFAVWPEGTDW